MKSNIPLLGEDNLGHMFTRFNSIDVESKGFLNELEIKELVRLTYVAPEHSITSFMNFFNAGEGKGITKDEFKS